MKRIFDDHFEIDLYDFTAAMKYQVLLFLFFIVMTMKVLAQHEPPAPLLPVPTEQQLAWHEMEQYAFIHFTTNTFTDKEWGYGNEDPQIFNPTRIDAGQWAEIISEAGLHAIILTCKHHDGFCLWPSKYTGHSVKNSPFRNGQGDVVKEVSDACRKYGLKFGVYLSPWDRNHPEYGTDAYIDYYRDQLTELFTGYGPVFEMWFDGANGGDGYYGGKNERRSIDGRTYYNWPATLDMIRDIQPGVLFFSDAGPDIRWCGNESGYAGETNWCTINTDTIYAGKAGITELLNTGSENGKNWIPAEVDVSIRPGWFYHQSEDDKVKTPDDLFTIYLNSVGRGANLLLNIPPDRRGLLHENDVKTLKAWREIIAREFANNAAFKCPVTASSYRGTTPAYHPNNLTDGNKDTYWATDDNIVAGSVMIDLGKKRKVQYILVQEYIRLGQRVKAFNVDVFTDDQWINVAQATTIGYKRIISFEPVAAEKIRLNIIDSKACPVLSNIEIY